MPQNEVFMFVIGWHAVIKAHASIRTLRGIKIFDETRIRTLNVTALTIMATAISSKDF
jgi:hypothetical protein